MTVKNRKNFLPVLLSIALVFSLIFTASMLNTAPVVAQGQMTPMVAADTAVSTGRYYSPLEFEVGDWTDIIQVAAGAGHTVGLKSDGTVVAVGYNEYGCCNVGGWTDITQVAAGFSHTAGVKSDGTVVALGDNYYGQCNVGGWAGINQTTAGWSHTVGLKSDGTVVAVGLNDGRQCDVGNWAGITQVAAGEGHTVGLKADGTVVVVGPEIPEEFYSGQYDVGNWTGIIEVASGDGHTVGLKSNRTVVAVGYSGDGQCAVGNWTNIIGVAAGADHTVGLKSDGTVVAVGWNEWGQCNVEGWTDIIQVAAGWFHTVGIKSDGTVVATGDYYLGSLPTPCFIATAAYGTSMAGEIEILRQFRDEYLLTNPLGQALVDLYYRVSPPIAGFITEHPSLKPIVRAGLVPVVAMSTVAVNTTPAEKIAILGLFVLVSAALAVCARRWRGKGPEYTRG
jgi:alpha-tubulin suppressor-like RCC1 family protein